jgi:hypothetical protein
MSKYAEQIRNAGLMETLHDEANNMQELKMKYKGPEHNCKVCEDEANGVKHIQAQDHTCKKGDRK